jgi:hypothetical protein
MQTYKLVFCSLAITVMAGCVKAPDHPIEPVLTYGGISSQSMDQGSFNNDSLYVFLSFTDGDGDLGYSSQDTTTDILVYDNRTNQLQERLKLPEVPDEGTSNGIEGEITLRLFNTCCLFPRNIPPCSSPQQYPTDTISYSILIIDRAGNKSNAITTDEVILRCN